MPGPTIENVIRKNACDALLMLLIAAFDPPSFAHVPDPPRAALPTAHVNWPGHITRCVLFTLKYFVHSYHICYCIR